MTPDAQNVLQAMMQLEQAKTRTKSANKVALHAEKEKDAAEQEVQRLQQLLQAKRARTHATTANDHEECDKRSSDDLDLADYRREATRIQNRRSTYREVMGVVSQILALLLQPSASQDADDAVAVNLPARPVCSVWFPWCVAACQKNTRFRCSCWQIETRCVYSVADSDSVGSHQDWGG